VETSSFSPAAELEAVHRVAYAIGRVIAKKAIADDAGMSRLDALGQAAAAHTMAVNMTNDLLEEARAAWCESNRIAAEAEDA
jgi:hypothetical protein